MITKSPTPLTTSFRMPTLKWETRTFSFIIAQSSQWAIVTRAHLIRDGERERATIHPFIHIYDDFEMANETKKNLDNQPSRSHLFHDENELRVL